MKKWTLGLVVFGLLTACGPGKDKKPTNPIDVAMAPLFEANGLQMTDAATPELCRRLGADLLGRFPSADEVDQWCAGRSVDEIVRDFQSRPEYLELSERHWRDRFDTNDVNTDWRYLQSLYAMVDDLHQGNITYEQFGIEVMAHPGFIMQDFEATDRAHRVFRAMMGRPASDAEANDLASLYRPWLPTQETDPDFGYTYRISAGVAPVLCEPIADCTAELFGGGQLDFGTQTVFQIIRYEDLSADYLDILKEPGRMLTRLQLYYEAGADEILQRYLLWNDGGRFPRTPGVVTPEVRQIVADYLKDTQDYAATERLVLTSVLYRGAAATEPDGYGDDPLAPQPPVWATGPVKWTQSETLINSMSRLLENGPLTAYINSDDMCDPRYTDLFSYALILNAMNQGLITLQQAENDIAKLHGLQGIRQTLTDYGNPTQVALPNQYPTYFALQLGGCPGFNRTRFDSRAGLSYSFQQETLAELFCIPDQVAGNLLPPGGDTSLSAVLNHQSRLLLSRDATADDISDFEAAYANCSGLDCQTPGMSNGVCVALSGSDEILFY